MNIIKSLGYEEGRTKLLVIAIIIILVEFLTIVVIVNNNNRSTIESQRRFDENFIQYLKSSSDVLKKVDFSSGSSKYNRSVIYSSASDISCAYSIVKYTSFSKDSIGYRILLEAYKLAFVNLSLQELIQNSKSFTSYMEDIVKDPHSNDKINKFYVFLSNLNY